MEQFARPSRICRTNWPPRREMEITYRYLVKPIPPEFNLANVHQQRPTPPCLECRAFLADRGAANNNLIKLDYEHLDWYPDFPLLKQAAKFGCRLCWFLRKSIRTAWAVRPMEEWGVGALSEQDDKWKELLGAPWDRRVKIHNAQFTFTPFTDPVLRNRTANTLQKGGMLTSLTLEFGPASVAKDGNGKELHGDISQVLSFKVYHLYDLGSPSRYTRRIAPGLDPLSHADMMVGSWIHDCRTRHDSCRIPLTPDKWLPRRLLSISRSPQGLNLKLVETEGPRAQASLSNARFMPNYIALSHMWGDVTKSPPLRTTKANYEAMRAEIRMAALPRNFIDAVRVCERFRVAYLWIDSLCIIQDDHEDWARELATMHLVYRYAMTTIVATSATSSHDGFLERNIEMTPAVKIGYISQFPESFFILAHQDDVETGVRRGDVDSSKWNSRGWTMQERSLSTRLIYFCKNNLYLECRECLLSESNEPEAAEPFRPFQLWPRTKSLLSNPETLFQHWRKAVIEYSHRQLTRASDKLPAIQSIAKEMADHVPGRYISFAGLWEADIQRQLLWYVERGNRVRLPEYRAPTWSWASLDVWVGFMKGSVGSQATTELSSQDTFELVGCGEKHPDHQPLLRNYIELKGLARPIMQITAIDGDDDYGTSATRGSFPYDIFGEGPDGTESVPFAHGMLDLDNWDNFLPFTRRLLYFHVLDDQHPSGLILELAPQELQGHQAKSEVWMRVGVATIFYDSGSRVKRQSFEETAVIIV